MKTRIEAGTDVAMIGAWDASRNDSALAGAFGKKLDQVLDQDSAAGNLFLIHTGADGGGPIDVYVDVAVPEDIRKQCRSVKREFLLSVPTGKLMIGGVEDYRTGKAKIAGQDSMVEVRSSDYALRCYVPKEESSFDPPTRAELEQAVGADDCRYYRHIQKIAVTAYFGVPLLFVALVFPLGWKKALVIATVVGLICYGLVRLISGNARFRRVAKAENELWRQAQQRGMPTLIIELHHLNNTTGLTGGSWDLSKM